MAEVSRLVAWGGRRDDDVQVGSAEDIVAAAFASGDVDQVRVPGLVPFAALPDLAEVQRLATERGAVVFMGRQAGKRMTMKAAAALPVVRRPERVGEARRRAKRRQLDAMRVAARATIDQAKTETRRAIGSPPRTAGELQADYDERMEDERWT